jgi:hypothetical protein
VSCPSNLDPNDKSDSVIEPHFINIGSLLDGTAGVIINLNIPLPEFRTSLSKGEV